MNSGSEGARVGPRTGTKCDTTYPAELIEACFYRGSERSSARRPICRPCLQTRRDEKKRRNRWLPKAAWTRSWHARKLGTSTRELETRFGWVVSRMAEDAKAAFREWLSVYDPE
jgi:hypothetical protein